MIFRYEQSLHSISSLVKKIGNDNQGEKIKHEEKTQRKKREHER
jgi:hypothetical protein